MKQDETETLAACENFFSSLNEKNIRYCHWKSNLNLSKSMAGRTDLDVLIYSEDKDKFNSVLSKFNIKKILSPPEKQFPGMEDYLGFDYDTGRLFHLHVHYRLILGQKYIKNHHLPIEELIFQNLTTENDIYIPCPELELILLIIRGHMKIDLMSIIKHGIKDFVGHRYIPFPEDIENEFVTLIKKSNIEKLKIILLESGLPLSEKIFLSFIDKFSKKNLSALDVLSANRQIIKSLQEFRRQKNYLIYVKYLYFAMCGMPLINKFVKPNRKTIVGRGKIFSLVGADGSGKSTLVKELETWLSWKLSVNKYYYGIPKTYYIKLISEIIHIFSILRINYAVTFLENFLWVYIAKKRYEVSLALTKDAEQGKTMITDRFPLKDFHKMDEPMDGPRILQSHSKISSFFLNTEKSYYEKINLPDHIFVLQVRLSELRNRKTDLDIETHTLKSDAVNAINENAYITIINANQSYVDVLLDIKRKIWKLL